MSEKFNPWEKEKKDIPQQIPHDRGEAEKVQPPPPPPPKKDEWVES